MSTYAFKSLFITMIAGVSPLAQDSSASSKHPSHDNVWENNTGHLLATVLCVRLGVH